MSFRLKINDSDVDHVSYLYAAFAPNDWAYSQFKWGADNLKEFRNSLYYRKVRSTNSMILQQTKSELKRSGNSHELAAQSMILLLSCYMEEVSLFSRDRRNNAVDHLLYEFTKLFSNYVDYTGRLGQKCFELAKQTKDDNLLKILETAADIQERNNRIIASPAGRLFTSIGGIVGLTYYKPTLLSTILFSSRSVRLHATHRV